MAATTTTSAVYIHVIEDVISKVREEFVSNGGPGESVLNELQGLWEMKMMQAGAICGPIERSAAQKATPGAPLTHDLNVPYEGTEEYETPTAEMLFPPTPMQTPLPTPLPGTADSSSMYNIPTGSSDYPTPASDNGGNADLKGSRPSRYMQTPSPWTNQRPVNVDVNIAYVEGRDEAERGNPSQPLTQNFFVPPTGKRKREEFSSQYPNGRSIPQQDGASDATHEASKENSNSSSLKIPQLDGPMPDPYDDILSTPNIYNYQGANEEYSEAKTPAPNDAQASTPAAAAQNDNGDEDDDELLNEDDDDDDDLDDLDNGDDMNTQHLVLAQFDKVTRTKSRWKCTLKDGIMHINDKDILFNKATGEFDF